MSGRQIGFVIAAIAVVVFDVLIVLIVAFGPPKEKPAGPVVTPAPYGTPYYWSGIEVKRS